MDSVVQHSVFGIVVKLLFMREVSPPSWDSSASLPGVNSDRWLLEGLDKGGATFVTVVGLGIKVRSGGAGSLYHLKLGFAERKASLYWKI